MTAATDRRNQSLPVAGQIVVVGRTASVQFAGAAGFMARVISVDDRLTYDGWRWLTCYQLKNGEAVERRSIYVRVAGLGQPPAQSSAGAGAAVVRRRNAGGEVRRGRA